MATIRARCASFQQSTFPLLDFYQEKGTLYSIDSPTSAVGYVSIQKILDKK